MFGFFYFVALASAVLFLLGYTIYKSILGDWRFFKKEGAIAVSFEALIIIIVIAVVWQRKKEKLKLDR